MRHPGSSTRAPARIAHFVQARSPGGLAGLALVAYLAFAAVKLAVYDFDLTRFVGAGDVFFSAAHLRYPMWVEPHSNGYDGQFFYRFALDPFTNRRVVDGISLEANPVVRGQRILYPLAAWALTLGQGRLVPLALLVLNLGCVAGVASIGARLAIHHGIAPRWGLLLAFYPGFPLSMARDTAEIVSTLLAVSALLAATGRRFGIAALLASLAVLTRETTLIYLAGFGVAALARSARECKVDPAIGWCLVPLAVFAAWQLALRSIWGNLPFDDLGHHDLALPPLAQFLSWLFSYAHQVASGPFNHKTIFALVTCLFVLAWPIFVLVQSIRTRTPAPEYMLPWLSYVLLASVFTEAIWNEPYGYLRILCDYYALGVLVLMAGRNARALRRLAPFVGWTWIGAIIYVL